MTTSIIACVSAISLVGCAGNQLGNLEASSTGDLSLGPALHQPFDADLVAACGEGGRTAAGERAIQRAPYLQSVTDRSASVLWTTTGTATARLVVWAPGSTDELAIAAAVDATASLPSGRQLIANLDGLEPAAIYCYEVRDGGDVLVAATGFRTAPEPGSDATIRLVAVGDLGQATTDQFAVADQIQDVAHELALLTGDVAYDSGQLSSFESYYFDVYETYLDNIPVFPSDGNHDFQTRNAGPYREVFALPENGGPLGREYWYSFDWGKLHIAVLDTEQVGAAQAAWLDEDLAQSEQPWKIVIGHRPPYSSGYHGSNGSVRDTFGPIFSRHGVQLTVWGHDHDYERTAPIDGVTYVVTGGGGVGTRPVGASTFTAFSEEVSHFLYVTIEGDELRAWAIDATGQTFDTMAIRQ